MTRSSTLVLALCMVLTLGLGSTTAPPATAAGPGTAPLAQASTIQPKTVQPKMKASRRRWRAPRGPYFNDPRRKAGHFRIERKLVRTIRHTPRRSTIRIAVYSFDRMPLANALVDAHRRGVKVQMLLNDHWNTRAMRVVRREVGGNRHAKSFLYRCKASCRGTANEYSNLHSKFYLFSRSGRTRDLLAVGSHNLTRNADLHQWNDLYFAAGNHRLFRQFVSLFNDMRVDYDTRQPPLSFCGYPVGAVCDDSVDKRTVSVFPRPARKNNDLVLDTLDRVQCLVPDGAGGQTRTSLILSMHTMRGRRGDYLAAAIRAKFAEGCKVRVSYGLIGYHTKRVLGAPTRRGRIPLRSTGLDFNTEDNFDLNNDGIDDLILSFYSHQKYLIVRGSYAGHPDTNMVITGSSNWASLSGGNDEIWMTVQGHRVVRKYVRNFNYQWRNQRNSRNAYTTTYSNFPGSPSSRR